MTQTSGEDDFDDELIADYREGFDDHYEIIINCIAALDTTPKNDASIDEMFRSMHTIKGNARILIFEQLASFLHSVEESISALRDHKIIFTELLGESITLSLDKAKEISEAIFVNSAVDDPSVTRIQDIFLQIQNCTQTEVDQLCAEIIKEITGFDVSPKLIIPGPKEPSSSTKPLFQTEMVQEMNYYISEDTPDSLREHLGYMRYLALLLETKVSHWQGRTYQLVQLLTAFNNELQNPLQTHQLEMAAYVHDMAFTFLPDTLMLKKEKFTSEELSLMQTHPQIAADFIGMSNDWDIAHEIVLQHHEKSNGTGYPKGLTDNQICIGAKMLSIIDAFIAMTTYRPDRTYKRSVLTALNEIKTQAGKQFSAELVPVFINLLVSQLK